MFFYRSNCMTTTWILVADEAIARILEKPRKGSELKPVEEFTDPDAHAREGELHNGPHGRRTGAGGGGKPQATVSAGDSERHQHARLFAARIAQRLLECRREKRFDAIHIVAAPRLLGYLRHEFHAELSDVIVDTLDKDLIHESNADLMRRLFPLPSATGAH
jgi:protein required for attachment to host cells